MAVALKAGGRFRSQVCDTEIVAVRAPSDEIDLCCGGLAMVPASVDVVERAAPADGFASGTQVGKRYVDVADTVQLLCVKAGTGSISIGNEILNPAAPKPLPSSD